MPILQPEEIFTNQLLWSAYRNRKFDEQIGSVLGTDKFVQTSSV